MSIFKISLTCVKIKRLSSTEAPCLDTRLSIINVIVLSKFYDKHDDFGVGIAYIFIYLFMCVCACWLVDRGKDDNVPHSTSTRRLYFATQSV